jgi:hypothetical protein
LRRRKKEEGRRKREEGRNISALIPDFLLANLETYCINL